MYLQNQFSRKEPAHLKPIQMIRRGKLHVLQVFYFVLSNSLYSCDDRYRQNIREEAQSIRNHLKSQPLVRMRPKDFCFKACVIDHYSQGRLSAGIVSDLNLLGFEVDTVFSARQLDEECGFIAVRVIATIQHQICQIGQ